MKISELFFICDENIHPNVIHFLQSTNIRLTTVAELGLRSTKDEKILAKAIELNAVVITHDKNFGKLYFLESRPFTGIIYLKPGHIKFSVTIETLKNLLKDDFDITFPFILVAERKGDFLTIRFRNFK